MFRAFALTSCFLILLLIAGYFGFRHMLNGQLRDRIQQLVNQQLSGSGIVVTIGNAWWQDGSGLYLSDSEMRLENGQSSAPDIRIAHLHVRSSLNLLELLSGQFAPEAIRIEGLDLHVNRTRDGGWNVPELIARWPQQDNPVTGVAFPVQVRNSSIELDTGLFNDDRRLQIGGINIDYRTLKNASDGGNAVEQFAGTFSSGLTGDMQFVVRIDAAAGSWTVESASEGMRIAGPVRDLLASASGQFSQMVAHADGLVSFKSIVSGHVGSNVLEQFSLNGSVSGFQCMAPDLPQPLHQGRFQFFADQNGGGVRDFHCHAGEGTLAGELAFANWNSPDRVEVNGDFDQIHLSERLVPWLPDNLKKMWDAYTPTGTMSGKVRFVQTGSSRSVQVRSTLAGGSCVWSKFPFKLEDLNGNIDLDDNVLTLSGTAVESQQLVQIDGRIMNPGRDWTGWVVGRCEGRIPITEKAIQAFQPYPGILKALKRFEATGHFSGWGRLERNDPAVAKPRSRYEITFHDATVRYDAFRYPFFHVNGVLDIVDGETTVRELSGQNKTAQVTCTGKIDRQRQVDLAFLVKHLTLDEELRLALPESLRKTWRSLRPAGVADRLDVRIGWRPGMAVPDISADGEIIASSAIANSGIVLQPVWFPYELRQVSARFRCADRRFDLLSFSGWHGQTSVGCTGELVWDEQAWKMRLNDLVATNVLLDPELKDALPERLNTTLKAIGFDGNVNLKGTIEAGADQTGLDDMTFPVRQTGYTDAMTPDLSPDVQLNWNLQIGIGNGRIDAGLPLRNIHGVVDFVGAFHKDQFSGYGELSIDSLMCDHVHITGLRGPVSLDGTRLAFGSFSNQRYPEHAPVPIELQLSGGGGRFDAQMMLDGDREFLVQAIASGLDLQELSREFSASGHDVAGKAYAALRLTGNRTGRHSLIGNGILQIEQARIYRLPVVLALLNTLRIKEPFDTAFDEGRVDFTVRGEDIDVDRIELNGDALSVIGNGSANLNRQIDLDFYTMMGRNRFEIPVVSALFRAGSQQVWWIQVDGNMDNPRTTHNILPGVNQSLKMLFPELENQAPSGN
jgi:AsmA-like C-terminal region